MVCTIIQLIFGVILLTEVILRVVIGWKYVTDFTSTIGRPFGINFPMHLGVIITVIQIILGAILFYRGIVGLF